MTPEQHFDMWFDVFTDPNMPDSIRRCALKNAIFGGNRLSRFDDRLDAFVDYKPHVYWFWRAIGGDGDHAIALRVRQFL